MATAIETLKTNFENGKKPTEQEFAELIDAFVHRDDDLQIFAGELAEISEAEQGVLNDKYMTPFLTKFAIYALTRLADIPYLELEVNAKDDAVKAALRDGIASSLDTLNKLHVALTATINAHVALTNNPHSVTKTQVGLGNLPNAKSDAITLNDSNTLATSKTVKTLNDNKEPVFGKNTAFNKNFGSGSNDVPRGNHTHTYLHYVSSQRAIAQSEGLRVVGKLEADTDVKAKNIFELKPNNGSGFERAFFGRYAGDTTVFIRVDSATVSPNWNGLYEFTEGGGIKINRASLELHSGAKSGDTDLGDGLYVYDRNSNTKKAVIADRYEVSSELSAGGFQNGRIDLAGVADGGQTGFGGAVIRVEQSNNGVFRVYEFDRAGKFHAPTSVSSGSDQRLKRNVTALADGILEKILRLNPIKHLWQDKIDEGKTTPDHFGLLAQELEQEFPELVDGQGEELRSVDYMKLTVPLIKAIQEQQQQIDELKSEIEHLKNA